jgi:hypothetical protein
MIPSFKKSIQLTAAIVLAALLFTATVLAQAGKQGGQPGGKGDQQGMGGMGMT